MVKTGKAMMILAWIVALAMLTYVFYWRNQLINKPNRQLAHTTTSHGVVEVMLKPDADHHYVFTGQINGVSVEFFIDTGATDVTLPSSIARQLNLPKGIAMRAQTANGVVTVYKTRLRELSIGPIKLYNVSASINPSMKGKQVLLGMSALKSIEFSQTNNELLLRH